MKVRLDQIADRPFTWRDRLTVSPQLLERDEVVGFSDLEWEGSVERIDSGFLLQARLAYEQELECPRCLNPSTTPVESQVELLVVQNASQPTLGEYELNESELGVLYVDGELLDLEPILFEQLQLNLPMRPLCRDDCAGLCPQCGADLNDGECSCGVRPVDARWRALKSLRDRFDNP